MQYIYTCATNFLHVNQRWLRFLVGSSVGRPLHCPLYPYLKVVGCLLSCKLSCPLYPYMEVVDSLIVMAKFSWQPTPLSTELPTFFTFGSSWLPTELPTVSIYGSSGQPNLHGKIPMGSPLCCSLFPYMEVVGSLLSCPLFPHMEVLGSLICMAKFPWAANGQPTPLPTCNPRTARWAAPVFSVWEIITFCIVLVGQFMSAMPLKLVYKMVRHVNNSLNQL